MTLIKFSDPFIKADILNKKSKKNFYNESLCAFVNSAMNIEFVYLILVGINNFMEIQLRRKYSQKTISDKSSTSKIEIIKTLEKTQIKYTDMKFEDIRKWDIG